MQVNGKTVFFSASTAKTLIKSGPRAARDQHWLLGHPEDKKTSSKSKGLLVDRLLFGVGGDIIELNYSWWSPQARKERDAIASENRRALIALPHEVSQAEFIVGNIREYCHGIGVEITPENAQRKIEWNFLGVDCKAIIDYHVPFSGLIVDLKTCYNLSYQRALESCWEYRYDIQAASYQEAIEEDPRYSTGIPPDVVFLFTDSKTGACLELPLTDEQLRYGREEWTLACAVWGGCLETNNWPETIQECAGNTR